jgi:hypothetical protein
MGTHLILHKVRGNPEFDVAERATIGEEEGWIISTSGHRAYPWLQWSLEDLMDTSDINSYGHHNYIGTMTFNLPEDLPDHYPAKASKEAKPEPAKIHAFLGKLGLGVKIVRRV